MNKILIADSQEIFCLGIKFIFQNNVYFEVVGIAVHATELYEKVELNSPDILLIDYETVADFKIEELKKIKVNYPKLKLCVICATRNRETIYKVLSYGISNYILKDCDAEEFVSALNATAAKQKYFSSFVIEILVNKKVWNESDENKNHLTHKEVEIIKFIAQGLTTKDIAAKLFISHHTVITHRKNIFRKLEVNSVSELIMFAIKAGIVDYIEYYI